MPRAKRRKPSAAPSRKGPAPRFVGRDPSPVLERYPPRTGPGGFVPPPVRAPPRPSGPPAAPPPVSSAPPVPPPEGLIRLEKPFDVDEFSQMLGETAVRVTVPPDALAEVLRRVVEFMGFGIYVYEVAVRPAPADLLKGYVVDLRRVEYDPDAGTWKPFVERGTVGPSGPE
jgi:hypothetical protein